MLTRIDELLSKQGSYKKANYSQKSIKWDEWKALPLADKVDDDWGFNQWDKPTRRKVLRGTRDLEKSKMTRNMAFDADGSYRKTWNL